MFSNFVVIIKVVGRCVGLLSHAYPYAEFSAELSKRSQQSLKEQYEDALSRNQIVLFVRDNQAKRLVSYSIDNEQALLY
jgi:hypothetical protein